MEVGVNFKNLASYNENMAKGMEDKLFFIKKLNLQPNKNYLFVDFGCADGVLIDTLYGIMKDNNINAFFIGYDISETMIELAKNKFSHYPTYNVLFTSKWDDVKKSIDTYSEMESVLILSSVIHEVYSYADSLDDIDLFWHRVLDSNFKYICIRDMMCSRDINRKTKRNLWVKLDEECPLGSTLRSQVNEFEKIWGSTHELNKQFIHFLLKYRWTINWKREVNENYFPIDIEGFLEKMESYNLIYFKRFRVPYLEKCWYDDFRIKLEDYTHIKAIFENKKNNDDI